MTLRTPSIEIACIGAAHIDRRARALGAVVPGSSNPVTVATSAGGVARNVAETLARLGARVRLVSRLGDDAEGERLLADLAARGVDISGVARACGAPTASYTALLDPSGQLVVGLANTAIYDGMDAAFVAPVLPRLLRVPVWFVDANVPEDGLARLLHARRDGVFVVADAVSVAKAPRLGALLARIDLLFSNEAEAAALTGSGLDAPAMAQRLRAGGAGSVVVTRGAAGAILATAEGTAALPAAPATVRDVTGAGDALVAATLLQRARGVPLAAALRTGLRLAALTAASEHAVRPDLSAALLDDALAEGAA